MPHFTLMIDGPGPVVNAAVFLTQGRRDAVTASGGELPTIQVVRALVDTGASITSIDPQVFETLGLTPTGLLDMVTPSTGAGVHTTDTYDVDFLIGAANGETPLQITNLRVCASQLFLNQGINALIGRDILSKCLMVYNGTINSFTMSF
jgi:hypothetical protein